MPPNEVIKVERGPKKGRKRMKEWGEVTFMKEWVKALSERSILAPADLRYLFSFPRYRNLKMHSWSIQIYNSNILPLLNARFEACFSGPNKPLLAQCPSVVTFFAVFISHLTSKMACWSDRLPDYKEPFSKAAKPVLAVISRGTHLDTILPV